LGNALSILDYTQKGNIKCEIEILANSVAVREYAKKEENYESSCIMEELNANKVKFLACRKAVKKCELDEQDLLPFVQFVPSGVVELTMKQMEGFAYIKP
jgi:uncharacterized protein